MMVRSRTLVYQQVLRIPANSYRLVFLMKFMMGWVMIKGKYHHIAQLRASDLIEHPVSFKYLLINHTLKGVFKVFGNVAKFNNR